MFRIIWNYIKELFSCNNDTYIKSYDYKEIGPVELKDIKRR